MGFDIDLELMGCLLRCPKRPVTFEPCVVKGFIRDAVHHPGLAFKIPYRSDGVSDFFHLDAVQRACSGMKPSTLVPILERRWTTATIRCRSDSPASSTN